MNAKLISSCCVALVASVLAAPALADIVVSVVPDAIEANVGDEFTVDIVADIPPENAIIGWGLDFTIDMPTVLSQMGEPTIGELWDAVGTFDDDGLAGALFPPTGVCGTDVLLATITLRVDAIGETELILGDDHESDASEGFALSDLSGFADVDYHSALVVIPEPTALSLLAFGALALIRRRR